jgi:mannose-6-phosphate isomerase
MVLDGNGTVSCGGKTLDITKGEGVFIPASAGDYTVNGTLTVLESRV